MAGRRPDGGGRAAYTAADIAGLDFVGMDVVEITPMHDVNQMTCITAGRLITNFIGMAVRAGYFDKR